jgi:hypothetical protein
MMKTQKNSAMINETDGNSPSVFLLKMILNGREEIFLFFHLLPPL